MSRCFKCLWLRHFKIVELIRIDSQLKLSENIDLRRFENRQNQYVQAHLYREPYFGLPRIKNEMPLCSRVSTSVAAVVMFFLNQLLHMNNSEL